MADILNVAWYITNKLGAITTTKLQKLVYYCQAWSLVWDEEPLFEEDFEAWANGPVCRKLFDAHKGKFKISAEDFKKYEYNDFTYSQRETMDIVLRDLGDKSGQWLSDLTHSERPWKEARVGCEPGESCSKIIEKEAMQEYYGGLSA